ncbi:MAG: TonB-dependent receptor [Campylobacterota bacterium]|nr:TonB-dependent receptor [Campylobacterota bacterium]
MDKILLSASVALLLSANALALENMDTLDVVSSIATKTDKSIDGVAATVIVISAKDIQLMGAESLKDIVSNTPGITVQYGTFPSASSKSKSSLSIRGMSKNGTLFLLDGRRLAGEVANPYDLDRIPASIIERIEIVKGPMSSLYGADAVGGVINVITKAPSKELQVDAGARYGTSQDGEAQNITMNLSLQGKDEAFGYSAYVSYTIAEPYTQNEMADVWIAKPKNGKPSKDKPSNGHPFIAPSDMKIQDFYDSAVTYREESSVATVGSRFTYDFNSDLVAGVTANYFMENRDGAYIGYFHPSNYKTPATLPAPKNNKPIPVYNIPVNSEDENNRLDLSVDLAYALSDELEIKARIYNSLYEKINTTTLRDFKDMNYASESDSAKNGMNANVDILAYELFATYLANDSHLVTTGVEYREEGRESSVFTQANTMTRKDVEYKSIYLQDEYEVSDALNMTLGARYDAISNAESKPTFRIGGIYEFSKLAKLRANFAQGFRTPDIREMYMFKQTPNGLKVGAEAMGYDLQPESTNAYEIGIGGSKNGMRYDVVAFYNQVNNMIANVMGDFNGKAAYTFENIADINTMGVEFSLNYQIMDNLNANIFWTELQTENETTGKDLEFQANRSGLIGFKYEPINDLSLGLNTKYIGEQNYTKVTHRGSPQEKKSDATTDSIVMVDAKVNYKVSKSYEIYGGVNNIADTKIDDVLGSNVGRYFFAGARIHF